MRHSEELERLRAAHNMLVETYGELVEEYALVKRRAQSEKRWGAFWAALFIITTAARVSAELGVLEWISSR